MPTHVVHMVEKPPPMQEECFREALSPEQSSNWRILQQWMVRSKDKGTVGSISREDIQWAVDMVGPLDVTCTHIVSMWGQVMGTVVRTIGGNQLCVSSGIKAASGKTIRTSNQQFELVEVLVWRIKGNEEGWPIATGLETNSQNEHRESQLQGHTGIHSIEGQESRSRGNPDWNGRYTLWGRIAWNAIWARNR